MKKNNENTIKWVILGLGVIICLLIGYIIINKKSSSECVSSCTYNEESAKMESYQIFENNNDNYSEKNEVDQDVKIEHTNYQIKVYNEDENQILSINGKVIETFKDGEKRLSQVYKIDNILAYTQINKDSTISVYFIKPDGTVLKSIESQFTDKLYLKTKTNPTITNGTIEFNLVYGYCGIECLSEEEISGLNLQSEITSAKLQFDYLGNGNFSKYRLTEIETLD